MLKFFNGVEGTVFSFTSSYVSGVVTLMGSKCATSIP